MQLDVALASFDGSFGWIFVAASLDILPFEPSAPTLKGVTAVIHATETAWSRGEIVMQSWRGREFKKHKVLEILKRYSCTDDWRTG